VQDFGAPVDVLWFKLTRQSGDPKDPVGRFDTGRVFIMLNRGGYLQCGFVVPKRSLRQIRERGLPEFRDDIVKLAPFVTGRVGKLQDWEEIKLLTRSSQSVASVVSPRASLPYGCCACYVPDWRCWH